MKRFGILITIFLLGLNVHVFSQQDGRGRNLSAEDRANMQTEHMKTELALDDVTEDIVSAKIDWAEVEAKRLKLAQAGNAFLKQHITKKRGA